MSSVRMMAALALLASPTFGQKVTDTHKVEIDGKVQVVRKINGRWWSPDNRQLNPTKAGYIWYISSDRAPLEFYHHNPVYLPRVEELRLFMSQDEVRDILGDPNETQSRAGLWHYYAEDGTAVLLKFVSDELLEARYERTDYGVKGRPVQAVLRDLDGREPYAVAADRAWQRRSPEAYAKFKGPNGDPKLTRSWDPPVRR
ncbi:MAG TPA: hypothetical protein VKU19_17040 [Bryobacteraceae bacterium]|nr:hypothetical protein [Bryobacteraceae bacterium]